jgi:hypothetical protein
LATRIADFDFSSFVSSSFEGIFWERGWTFQKSKNSSFFSPYNPLDICTIFCRKNNYSSFLCELENGIFCCSRLKFLTLQNKIANMNGFYAKTMFIYVLNQISDQLQIFQ